MIDGWYRITWPKPLNYVRVERVEYNSSQSGGVRTLLSEGCSYEQVLILTPQEFLNNLKAEERNTILAVKAGLL